MAIISGTSEVQVEPTTTAQNEWRTQMAKYHQDKAPTHDARVLGS